MCWWKSLEKMKLSRQCGIVIALPGTRWGVNCTFIVLIPKVDVPLKLSDYRPISLVGCTYKVLAKVLANRLSKVIGNVISVNQSAFVKGRQILDGILIANEIVDEAKKKKKELILFKVDFEKAYDSVEWSYLFSVMRKMNFPWKWRRWISECVRSASASVLVNGSPTDEFTFERGLRQGDPLSPFLFLIAAEGLNAMVNASVHANLFSGFSVGEDVPFQITHLQFADDTLMVADKNWANIRAIKSILLLFEVMSGLKVNFHKSLLVGVNVADSCPVAASSATPRGGLPNDSEEDSVVTLDQVPRWVDAEHSLENDNRDPLAFQSGTGSGAGGSVSRFPVDHEINSRIYLWRGDPWNLEVDAVVNSTNEVSNIPSFSY
ncbi:hypothetical protein TSUD_220120 [Trifolium subterraneum]|uniref:Reverse transcriptase domain-containing protein n=1 Tax=Trifolium subterraneum TaxID=3900 RepID=A0A2Z6N4D0_TRISU|nr:hypothetical protein TSUD_220120 [Trifolium subterraneum]